MADTNGRNKWIMWLAGLLATLVLCIALPTMAAQIWQNDRNNVKERQAIREMMINRDEAIVQKILNLQDSVTSIKIEQMRNRTILERIENKL